MAAKAVGEQLDALRIEERMGDLNGLARVERKLTGVGSSVGSLASAYGTSKAAPTRRADPGLTIAKIALVRLFAHTNGKDSGEIAEVMYPNDQVVAKAVSVPAAVSIGGWAADLSGDVRVFDGVVAVTPASVYAQLARRASALRLDFSGVATVRVVSRANSATNNFFVPEGDPNSVQGGQLRQCHGVRVQGRHS